MKFKQQIIVFLMIIAIGSAVSDLFSQNIKQKPSRQSSFEAFSKENYEQAYDEFSELLLVYSKDPLYNYYAGVCLVKLNRDPNKAVILLNQALQVTSGIKKLPSDVYFYQGRALQMSGKFTEAIESYTLFTEKAGKKTAKGSGVPEFIKQCNEKKGEVAASDIRPPERAENFRVDSSATVTKPEQKEVSSKINPPAGYDKLMDQGLEFQYYADSLNSLVGQQKKELETIPNAEKPALKMKISENEKAAVSFQKAADQKYNEAHMAINPLRGDTEKSDTIKQPDNKPVNDLAMQSGNENKKNIDKQSEIKEKSAAGFNRPVELFTIFELLPKPVSDPKAKIVIDPEVPAGLIYRIQMGVFRNPVSPSYFKGINPVYGFKIPGTDKTSYFAGMFRKSTDAVKALATIKSLGFNDSFIVALFESKRVSSDRAAVYEKEWGMKPFVTIEKQSQQSQTPADTIPPSLSFKVEVVKSQKPLKEDVTEGIKKIAGTRVLDIQSLDDGNIAYMIGKFITFESAAEYCDLLIRNGYSEAKVVAFLGKKEIPIDTAKHFFDKLK